MAPQHAQVIG